MSLAYAADATLSTHIKHMVSRAVAVNSTLTVSQKSVLLMGALSAAGNIGNEALRLATIKWVGNKHAALDLYAAPDFTD